ncbi:MAG TPA: DegT/DnrJ/EryC1/StrS family aminotransferase [Polyangia bacterium]|jgi:dTDP-4-amino-4,6-dideoxygalactose transaminase
MSEDDRIGLSEPYLAGNARAYLEECLTTNFVSSVGPFVDRFERAFADYVGSRFAIACASGTAALHVAMRLAGVEAGDEVLVPTLTFVASVNPIIYQGATPVLVDAEATTWNADPALIVDELELRARTGRRQPKAVEVVHLLGHPADIVPVAAACDRHGVTLIEDAAEALGARYVGGALDGRHVGTIGKIGCFSFNGNKIITCGAGGMITTDDEALARRAKHLTTQARMPGIEYRHDEVGYNYRLSNLSAALGLSQLEVLGDILARRKQNAARYDRGLAGARGLAPPPRAAWGAPTFWLYTIDVDPAASGTDRTALMARLRERRIEARPIWSPIHTMQPYAGLRAIRGQVAETVFARALSLPSSASLTAAQQDRVLLLLRGEQ